jgi:PadR family transcriptional regulator, regulatory protein AphA
MSSEDGIRLSSTSYAVLGMIGYLEPCTPYDLKRFIDESIANFWPVPHTTFYAEPARLAANGYLSEQREDGGRRRKLYSLTQRGRDALQAWVALPTAAPPELRDELELKVFLGADPGPLIEQRLQWHRQKLTELEGYLSQVRKADWPTGLERSLVGGTAYHRILIDLLEGLSGSTAPTSAESGRPRTAGGFSR